MTHTFAIAHRQNRKPVVSILSLFEAKFLNIKKFMRRWVANTNNKHLLRDLTDRNLQDIGLTSHDVSFVGYDSLPASEYITLADLRRTRSCNW